MGFHKWSDIDSDFPHEYEQLNDLAEMLRRWSKQNEIDTHLLANFWVGGEQIDAAIIIPNCLVVIELKTGTGTVIGEENGDWCIQTDDGNNIIINQGRKNPLIQARTKRYAIMDYLEARKEEIFSSKQKASQMSFEHTSSLVVFNGKISWDKNQVPKKVLPWFDVISINMMSEKLKAIRSNKLSLSPEESWTIPTLLSLGIKKDQIEENKGQKSGIKKIFEDINIDTEFLPKEPKTGKDFGISETVTKNVESEKKPSEEIKTSFFKTYENKELAIGCNFLTKGVFDGVDILNRNVILIKTKDNTIRKVFLNEGFFEAVNDLKKLVSDSGKLIKSKDKIEITLINTEFDGVNLYLKDNLESLLIIEPLWLINVTALADFNFCQRSLFNNRYSLGSQQESMIRGSIIHEVFESLLKENALNDSCELKESKVVLNKAFNSRALDFVLTETDYSKMYNDSVKPQLDALSNHIKENLNNIKKVDTERFIINPLIGLKGKIDAVITTSNGIKAIELKTGKGGWGDKVKYGHDLQAQAYTIMMQMKYNSKKIGAPSVIYSGEYERVKELRERYGSQNIFIEKSVNLSYIDKAHVISMRNKLVMADYLFTLPYETNQNKCNNCSKKSICRDLFELEEKHDPSNIPVFINSSITSDVYKKYSDKEKGFFNRYNRFLIEEYRVIKEFQGQYLIKKPMERIALGKCVEIENFKLKNLEVNLEEIKTPEECYGKEYILNCINNSEIRESDSCLLSDKDGPVFGECIEVVVSKVTCNSITIRSRVKIEFEPAFLDLYSPETIFERNFSAIYAIINDPALKNLKNILIAGSSAKPNLQKKIESSFKKFNPSDSQKKCIELARGLEEYLLIQGPPGTGKTITIAMIVNTLFSLNKSIIISCYTNRAINEVIRKIIEYAPDVPIYRIGERQRADEMDGIWLEDIINIYKSLDEKVTKAKEIIYSSDPKPVYIGTTNAWLKGNYDNLKGRNGSLFDIAIIDEASQVLLPNAIGVIRLAEKFILVGDHNQLPPVIQSKEAKELSKTLFEILFDKKHQYDENIKVTLETQHRMPVPIAKFIASEFYNNKLITADEISKRKLEIKSTNLKHYEILNPDIPLTLVSIKNHKSEGMARKNPKETKIIVEILSDLLSCGIEAENIGIIAPFRAQVADIRRALENKLGNVIENWQIIRTMVDTVDRFQGDERDVIIFSLTLLDSEIPEILNDRRRLNVAISRTRKKFIGIGNWDLVDSNETLRNLKEYVKNSEGCKYITLD